MMNKNKILCKNTLKGYNTRHTELINIFTEGWYYEFSDYKHVSMIIGNDYCLYCFIKDISDDAGLYIYDWFYTPAESRQKQIDSVIN